jgi:hypothetical protein
VQPVDVALGCFVSGSRGHVRQRPAAEGEVECEGLSSQAGHWDPGVAWSREEDVVARKV